ncbi:hypothetical protein RO3G_11379 [Rhizopus delemar RA 99-880]|uniref:Uncharacterized protein n=1 Tax=Rhizopus delemar (strain RA 99-880 / ATCC MYA-4621 / FGSC 9543 / NRRL 43880) TaxID=246409 RepID=I1CDY8_RHIO9|nr:hypothetical protein RO3G_11379 [Rhizopus delemar RA 99-880]|eukprot:EIE86668.1 hypothetical protein RO3G_11379 [Rhizopus delemar RA 99-880]
MAEKLVCPMICNCSKKKTHQTYKLPIAIAMCLHISTSIDKEENQKKKSDLTGEKCPVFVISISLEHYKYQHNYQRMTYAKETAE